MSESDSGTHPVYIGRDLKKNVKVEATQRELTMRQITERLINRGMDEGFHTEPLPQEFLDDLDDLSEEVERARNVSDLDRIEARLDDLEDDFEASELPEDGAEGEIEDRIADVRDSILDARSTYGE